MQDSGLLLRSGLGDRQEPEDEVFCDFVFYYEVFERHTWVFGGGTFSLKLNCDWKEGR